MSVQERSALYVELTKRRITAMVLLTVVIDRTSRGLKVSRVGC